MFRSLVVLVMVLLLPACVVEHRASYTHVVPADQAITRAAGQIRRQNAPSGSIADKVGLRLNAERRARGLSPISYNRSLSRVAQGHANWLAQPGIALSHTNGQGKNAITRVRDSGYGACRVAENLGQGQETVDVIMRDWLGSSGHRDNIFLPNLQEFGLALHPERNHWVLLLAAPGC